MHHGAEGDGLASIIPLGLGLSSIMPLGLGLSSIMPLGLGLASIMAVGVGLSAIISVGVGEAAAGDEQAAATARTTVAAKTVIGRGHGVANLGIGRTCSVGFWTPRR